MFSISSCKALDYVYAVTGIENYHEADSPYGTTALLLPNKQSEFLELYPYISGDYDYYEISDWYAYETAILYVEYDEEIYADAKSHALKTLPLDEKSIKKYKKYEFLQRSKVNHDEQRMFFGYCDEKRILIFVGTYMSGSYEYEYSTLAEYLETYFSFYNWEEGKIERENVTRPTPTIMPQTAEE